MVLGRGAGSLRAEATLDGAHLAAATLAIYRERMENDLLLALLAYNIGPNNQGLADVRRRYGARTFVDAQPYLQSHPRDYPIRVLAFALAYRVWREVGVQLAYEDDGAALRIQALGVPGLIDAAA